MNSACQLLQGAAPPNATLDFNAYCPHSGSVELSHLVEELDIVPSLHNGLTDFCSDAAGSSLTN